MEVAEIIVDKHLVEKRVADLYSTIKTWLIDSEYSLKLGPKLTMFEELMSRFSVPPTDIDTADVSKTKVLSLP
jgi:hypothetical protein